MGEHDPRDALSIIRNKLQVILGQAELCQSQPRCEICSLAVRQIVEEMYDLEAYVRDALKITAPTTQSLDKDSVPEQPDSAGLGLA